jgi:hypothetical protein
METLFVLWFIVACAGGQLKADFKDWGGRKLNAAQARLENRRAQLRTESKRGLGSWLKRAPARMALAAAAGAWGAGRSIRVGAQNGVKVGREKYAERKAMKYVDDGSDPGRDPVSLRKPDSTPRGTGPAATPKADPVPDPLKAGQQDRVRPAEGPGPVPQSDPAGRAPAAAPRLSVVPPAPVSPSPAGQPAGGQASAGAAPLPPRPPKPPVSQYDRDVSKLLLYLDGHCRLHPPLTEFQRYSLSERARGEHVNIDYEVHVGPPQGSKKPIDPTLENYLKKLQEAGGVSPGSTGFRSIGKGPSPANWTAENGTGAAPTIDGPIRSVPISTAPPVSRPAAGINTSKENTMSQSTGEAANLEQVGNVLASMQAAATSALEDATATARRAQADLAAAERLAGFAKKVNAPNQYQSAMAGTHEGPAAAVAAANALKAAAERTLAGVTKAVAENNKQKTVAEAAAAAGGAMKQEAYASANS